MSLKHLLSVLSIYNINKLKTLIQYPLQRQYPLADVKSEEEFIVRFSEIFDDSLKMMIINSDLKNNWAAVGYKGIMLHRGILWLDYDDGKVIGVNYQSNIEKDKRQLLLKTDKRFLHVSLKEFKKPLLLLETSKFRVRIDELENGSL